MSNWFPENVSTFGGDVDGIFWFIFYITAVWFFLTEGLIVYFIFRYRRKPGQKAAYVRGDTVSQLAWVFVPVAIVVVLDFFIDLRSAEVWAKIKGQLPPPMSSSGPRASSSIGNLLIRVRMESSGRGTICNWTTNCTYPWAK